MDQVNLTYKKLPYRDRRIAKTIIIITTFVVYIGAIAYTKMQTKLYRSTATISFKWDNKIIEYIIKNKKDIDLGKVISDTAKSTEVTEKAIKELGLSSNTERATRRDFQQIQYHLNKRIRVAEKDKLTFNILLESAEPKKATMIVNKVAELVNAAISNKYSKFIADKKEALDGLNVLINEGNLQDEYISLLKSDFEKDYRFTDLIFNTYPPKTELTQVNIPRIPFYPNERRSALGGLVVGLILGFIFSFIFLTKRFLKVNDISVFEEKK